MTAIVIKTIAVCLLFYTSGYAQYVREFNPWPVITDGDTLAAPFWGGFNDPKPTLIDFNDDGLVDLLIGDPGGRLGYFENTGTATDPEWTAVVERLAGIDIATWHRLADIDADGDLDLFCDSRSATTSLYRNDGGTGANVVFTLVDTAYGGFATGFNNTPDFADIDDDGDLDFFLGATTGQLEFYRNDGDSVTAAFVFADAFYDSVLAFPSGAKSPRDPQHGFSSIYFSDVNDDNDQDLLWGDIFNLNMYFFENLGTADSSDLTLITEKYLDVATLGFNHPTLADVDGDSILDMVLGVANGAIIDNLQFLRNLGTPENPFFAAEDSNLIKNIDVGSFAHPTFGDIDGDGDLDLLVGAHDGRLRHFENTGTKYEPTLELMTTYFKTIDVGSNAAPVLVDWDDDDDLDLLIGTNLGRIQYWRNDGDAQNFTPVLESAQLAGIKVDQLAIPRPVDLNKDNLTDLVVGEWDFNSLANVLLYQNIGAPGSPSLVLATSKLLPQESREFTLPQVYDWNEDGIKDVILGGRSSGLRLFLNTGSSDVFPDSTTLVEQTDTIPGFDNGAYLALVSADIDGDGDQDLFVGEENGGLSFYRLPGDCCDGERGNVDGVVGAGGAVDVADVSVLVGFLFRGGSAPPCELEANVDGTVGAGGPIDVADLSYLVAYLFTGGPLPPACP